MTKVKLNDVMELAGPMMGPGLGRRLLYAAKNLNPKYVKHALKSHMVSRGDVSNRVLYMRACPKCERATIFDSRPGEPRGMVTCPICAYHGPPGPPISVEAIGVTLRDGVTPVEG